MLGSLVLKHDIIFLMKLTPSQLKALSEFMNMLAVAWFTAGVITPFFLEQGNIIRSIILAAAGIFMSVTFLAMALLLLRKVKI